MTKRPLPDLQHRRRPRRVRVRPIPGLSFNRMLPNVITLLGLCAGMTAIRFAINGKYEGAVGAIVVAALFDALDGRVARLLKASSSFGAQLDSLSDFVCFGVAPALLLYIWTLSSIGSFGWAIALLFGVCSALRLARFNAQLGIPDVPSYAYNFFTGVPAPAGAGLALLPLCAAFDWDFGIFRSPYLAAITTLAIAALMVSRVPTFSGKRLHVPREYAAPLMIGVGIFAGFLTTEPWATLIVAGLLYLASIPWSVRSYRKLQAAAAELRSSRSGDIYPLHATEPNRGP